MSGIAIVNGTGDGLRAKVDANNELHVHARVLDHVAVESKTHGNAFFLATEFITLTATTSENAVWWIKNTSESKNLIIHSIRVSSDDEVKWRMVANPTAGTIITGAAAGDTQSLNLSLKTTLSALFYVGVSGNTFSDGNHFGQWVKQSDVFVMQMRSALILGPQDTCGLTADITTNPTIVGSTVLVTQEDR